VDRAEPVGSGQLLVADDFSTAGFRAADVGSNDDRLRSFSFNDVSFRAEVSKSPFQPPFGTAAVVGRQVIGSGRGNTLERMGRIPLWITKEWVFILDPAEDPDEDVTGRLVAFVLATDRLAAAESLSLALRDRLPALEEKCRASRGLVAERERVEVAVGGGPAPEWGDSATTMPGSGAGAGFGDGGIDWPDDDRPIRSAGPTVGGDDLDWDN